MNYTDPCTLALQTDKQLDQLFREIDTMYRDTLCVEEQLSNDEYLDKLDRKLYEQSNPY